MEKQIKKGQIYYADMSPVIGSEQGGYRPVLIIQNDIGNKFSPTTIVAIITSRETKANIPTHHWIDTYCGLSVASMVECEQLRTIDKRRLKKYVGKIDEVDQRFVDRKLKISLGMV